MSSGGQKRLVFNTNERILSSDQTRDQALTQRARMEFFRNQMFAGGDDDINLGEGPLNSNQGAYEILRGLMVQPSNGTFNVFVQPGVLLYQENGYGNAEDSILKEFESAGVTVSPLAITPNTSGSPRFDVVYAVPNYTLTVDTLEPRDIYNQISNTFSAASVAKVRREELQFGVEVGSPGFGLPSLISSSFIPLAVILIPSGAADLDACTIWDLRRMLHESEFSPFAASTGVGNAPKDRHSEFYYSPTVSPNPTPGYLGIMEGYVSTVYNGKRVGGLLRRGTEGSDANAYVDFGEAKNQDVATASSMIPPLTGNVYAYLVFPNGWPRWARYTDTPGTRVPRNPRGIPIVSTVPPDDKMRPTNTLNIFGMGLHQDAVCIAVLPRDSDIVTNGYQFVSASGRIERAKFDTLLPISGTATGSLFHLQPASLLPGGAIRFPKHARELFIKLRTAWLVAASTDGTWSERILVHKALTATVGTTPGQVVGERFSRIRNGTGSPANIILEHDLWIPNPLVNGGTLANFALTRQFLFSTGTYVDSDLTVLGYRW